MSSCFVFISVRLRSFRTSKKPAFNVPSRSLLKQRAHVHDAGRAHNPKEIG